VNTSTKEAIPVSGSCGAGEICVEGTCLKQP
jgi:hypothetical protein